MYRSIISHSVYSVFTSKFAAAILLFLMISGAAAAGDTLQAQPGEVLVIDHSGEKERLHVAVMLSPDGGEIGRYQSFTVRGKTFPGNSNRSLQRVLVPLSSTIADGTYRLSLCAQ